MNIKNIRLLLFFFVILCVGINACENFEGNVSFLCLKRDEAIAQKNYKRADTLECELQELFDRCLPKGVNKQSCDDKYETVYIGLTPNRRLIARKLYTNDKKNYENK